MEMRQTTYPLGEEDAALARGALDRGLDKRVGSEGKHLRARVRRETKSGGRGKEQRGKGQGWGRGRG